MRGVFYTISVLCLVEQSMLYPPTETRKCYRWAAAIFAATLYRYFTLIVNQTD